jgi:hypothetical protein
MVQRGILEIIPMLRPTNILSSMWTPLLLELLCYLKGNEGPFEKNSKQPQGRSSDAMANGAKHAFGKTCDDIFYIIRGYS